VGLLVCMGVRAAGQVESNESKPSAPSPPKSLQEYLAHPPWIRYAYWLRSGNHNPASTTYRFKKYTYIPKEWQELEGALQPGGFYMTWLYNPSFCWSFNPEKRKWEKNTNSWLCKSRMISGADTKYWWQLVIGPKETKEINLTLAPRKGQPGWDPKNDREIIIRNMGYELIRTLQTLGIPELSETERIEWLGSERFIAHPARYNGEVVEGMTVEGEVVEWANAWPLRIQYTVSRKEAGKDVREEWKIWYKYNGPAHWPPEEIYRRKAGEKDQVYTIRIVKFEPGINPAHKDGYSPYDFLPKERSITHLFINSNAVAYRITPSGQMVRYGLTAPKVPREVLLWERERKERVYQRIFLFVTGASLVALIGVILSRRRGAKREKQRSENVNTQRR